MEVPQEKKVTVETFDGPVEYEFTNFPTLDASPRTEKKHKKKHKKKKHKKKKKKNFSFLWPALTIGILSILAYFIIFPITTPIAPKRRSENLIVTQRGHNTTAVPFNARTMQADRVLPLLLVEQMKQRANLHVLCMHHLRYTVSTTYQACAVRSGTPDIFYYMVNPRIIRLDDKEITVQEDSIASLYSQQKTRRRCVLAEWTDHTFNLTGRLCGSPAISLQMAIEEFKNGKTGAQKI